MELGRRWTDSRARADESMGCDRVASAEAIVVSNSKKVYDSRYLGGDWKMGEVETSLPMPTLVECRPLSLSNLTPLRLLPRFTIVQIFERRRIISIASWGL